MTAPRAFELAGSGLVVLAVAVAAISSIVMAPADLDRCAEAVWLGKQIFAAHAIPVVFGPGSAASSAASGSIGWLAQLVVAIVARGHSAAAGCAAIATVAVFTCFAFVGARTARLAAPAFVALAIALVFASAIDVFRIGGATAILAFGAAYAFALDRETRGGLALLAVVVIFWCNADASGVLAPILALANAIGRTIETREFAPARHAWLAFAVTFASLFATPALGAYPLLAFRSLRLAGSFGEAIPWAPATLAPLSYHVGFTVLVLGMLAFGVRARGARDAVVASVAILVSLANADLLPLATIVVAPTLAVAAARANSAWLPRFGHLVRPRPGRATFVLIAAIGAFAVGSFGFVVVRGETTLSNDERTHETLHALAMRGTIRRVACVDLRSCDGAVALGLHVLADERIGAMPSSVRRAQATIARARRGWRIDLATYGIDAVVAERRSPLAALLEEVGWRNVSPSGGLVVFVRPSVRT